MAKLSKYFFSILLIFVSWSLPTKAQQNAISGTVRNAQTGRTLLGTNIFLDRTTIGTQAGKSGNYVLKNIPLGTYTIVFSFVGFKSFTTQVTFPKSDISVFNIKLKPKLLRIENTTVKADNSEWRANLKKFKQYFLGYTKNARDTKILNPEVLDFRDEQGNFVAFANKPLKIINKQLGFKIKFYLKKLTIKDHTIFTYGHSKFTLMNPDNENQKKYWQKERKQAYNGSFRHFINALISASLRKEGYIISFSNSLKYKNYPIRKLEANSIQWANRLYTYRKLGQIKLSFHKDYNYLRVDYLKEHPERGIAKRAQFNTRYHQVSFVKLPRGKAIIDIHAASEVPPYRAELLGYWGWTSRIPDLLPKNYTPQNE